MSSLFVQYGIRAQKIATEEPTPDYDPYVTFENGDGSTISVTPVWSQSDVELQYSFDAQNWSSATSDTEIENTGGNKIYMRGKAPTDKSLFFDDGFDEKTGTSENPWVTNATKITGNLNYLLCDELGDTEAPTVLDDYAYAYMFLNCTSLAQAPELPATSVGSYGYRYMFYGCTSLAQAPELPATSVGSYGYSRMFEGCTSLETVPSILPDTSVGDWGYAAMFSGCTSLAQAPELPATSVGDSGYRFMFYGCTSLETVPSILPATSVGDDGYRYMFEGCTSLAQAPELPATSVGSDGYRNMFNGCTSLMTITLGYEGTDTDKTGSWVEGVDTSGGTLYKAGSQYSSCGDDTYPCGWTQVQD